MANGKASPTERFVGAPGMNGIALAIADGVEVRLNPRVERMQRRGGLWLLHDYAGRELSVSDFDVVCPPCLRPMPCACLPMHRASAGSWPPSTGSPAGRRCSPAAAERDRLRRCLRQQRSDLELDRLRQQQTGPGRHRRRRRAVGSARAFPLVPAIHRDGTGPGGPAAGAGVLSAGGSADRCASSCRPSAGGMRRP